VPSRQIHLNPERPRLKGIRNLLSDSPDLLWISRGKPDLGARGGLKTLKSATRALEDRGRQEGAARHLGHRRVARLCAHAAQRRRAGAEPARNRLYITW